MVVVRLEELIRYSGPAGEAPSDSESEDDELCVFILGDLSNARPAFAKLWAMVMILALRDNTSSIHYHPWRKDGALAYVVENVRYEMVPPHEFAAVCIDVARELFTRPRRGRFLSRLRRGSGSAASSAVRAEFGAASLWDAVCWSTGERAGVELYLVERFV